MSYPNGYRHVDQATGISYTWDGQQWLRDDDPRSLALPNPQPSSAPASYAPQQYPAPAYPQAAASAYVSDKSSKNVQAIIAWVVAIVTFGYMLPWAIAATRGKSNAGMVGIVNLLLGWTLVGWIIALVMACGAHQIAAAGPSVSVVTAVGIQNAYPQMAPQYQQPAWNPNGQAAQTPAAGPSHSYPAAGQSSPYGTAELPPADHS